MSQYFPKLYEPFGGDINVKVDLSNYATKTDIKNISHVHTRSFALCVPDIVKNLNVKVLNIMSRTNEICKCKCRLDASVCNNKQRCNGDKCRCECKELIDKGVYDKGSIWNPSNCECECDKSCNSGEYLEYEK